MVEIKGPLIVIFKSGDPKQFAGNFSARVIGEQVVVGENHPTTNGDLFEPRAVYAAGEWARVVHGTVPY